MKRMGESSTNKKLKNHPLYKASTKKKEKLKKPQKFKEKQTFIDTDSEELDDYANNKSDILGKILEIADEFGLTNQSSYNVAKKLDFQWALEMLKDVQYKYEDYSNNYLLLKERHKKHYDKTQKALNEIKRIENTEKMRLKELEVARLKEIQKKRQEEKNKMKKGRRVMARVFVEDRDIEQNEEEEDEGIDENLRYFA